MAPAASKTEKVGGITRLMIKSMKESLKIPHFNYGDEIQVDDLVTLRTTLKVTRLISRPYPLHTRTLTSSSSQSLT